MYSAILLTTIRIQTFTTARSNFDIETMGRYAKLLCSNPFAADIVSLHVPIRELIGDALTIFNDYDCETVGENVFQSYLHWSQRASQVTPRLQLVA